MLRISTIEKCKAIYSEKFAKKVANSQVFVENVNRARMYAYLQEYGLRVQVFDGS